MLNLSGKVDAAAGRDWRLFTVGPKHAASLNDVDRFFVSVMMYWRLRLWNESEELRNALAADVLINE